MDWLTTHSVATEKNRFASMTPNWASTSIETIGNQTIYEIELLNPNNIFQSGGILAKGTEEQYRKKNSIKLLVFKDRQTNIIMYASYLSIIDDQNSMENKSIRYKSFQKLNGRVLYYNIDGSFANGWRYVDGRAINPISSISPNQINAYLDKLSEPKIGNFKRERIAKESSNFCLTGIPDYGISCVTVGGYTVCNYYVMGVTYVDACGGGGGMIGDPGGYYPTPIDQPHSGGGGNGNNGQNRDIIDSLHGYPCAQDLVRQLPTLKNDIASIINSTFGVNSNIDLVFSVDYDLKNTTTDGVFLGYAGGGSPNSGTTYKIGLNPDILKNSSKEFILVTLYHEALHAYVAYSKATMSAELFTLTFGSLEFNGGRTLFLPIDGHLQLSANNYLTGLKNSILSLNSSYDPGRAYSLAKGGVVVLTTADSLVNTQERDTTKPGYTGTKCP